MQRANSSTYIRAIRGQFLLKIVGSRAQIRDEEWTWSWNVADDIDAGVDEIGGVVAAAAVDGVDVAVVCDEDVVAAHPAEHVVAGPAIDRVAAAAAGDGVVPAAPEDQDGVTRGVVDQIVEGAADQRLDVAQELV